MANENFTERSEITNSPEANDEPIKPGEHLDELALNYAQKMNNSPVAEMLKNETGETLVQGYKEWIRGEYPAVFTFNTGLKECPRMLINEINAINPRPDLVELAQRISKLDAVTDKKEIGEIAQELISVAELGRLTARQEHNRELMWRYFYLHQLAEQIDEEVKHNNDWRTMMELHGLSHEEVYQQFNEQFLSIPADERKKMTQNILTDLRNHQPIRETAYPNIPLPKAVLGLCDYLIQASTAENMKYSIYKTAHSVIEFILIKVVTEVVYPAASEKPELSLDNKMASMWFAEHSFDAEEGEEEREHFERAKRLLNRMLTGESDQKVAFQMADDIGLLFSATMSETSSKLG